MENTSLTPGEDKKFIVNTSLFENPSDNEVYCFNTTLEEISHEFSSAAQTLIILFCIHVVYAPCSNWASTNTSESALDPPVIVGIAVAAIVLIPGVIIGIIIAYFIYRKLTHTSNKDYLLSLV